MSDLADALLAASRAAPSLDPTHLYGIAQSTSLDDVPDTATAIGAFGDITKRVGYLKAQDNTVQASAWASAGDEERQMLTAAGYRPPALKKHSTGPFAAVGHFLGDVAEIGLVKPGEGLAHGAGEALHYLGAPLRQLQHAYRAAALITDENVLAGRGQMSLHGVFSPAEWAQMWRLSEHGEQTFSPVALRDMQSRYDPATLDLAKQLAGGTKIEDLVKRTPDDEKQALVNRVQSDPDLKLAVRELNAAKLSVGRRIVGVDLQVAHPALGSTVSGTIDGLADWFGDPVVIGSKISKGAELARYTVRAPEDVDRAFRLRSVQNFATSFVDTLNSEGGVAAVANQWPKYGEMAAKLKREGVDTVEGLQEYFRGVAGMSEMISGRAGGALKSGTLLPHMGITDRAALAAKGGLRTAINWAADPARIAQQLGDDQALTLTQRAGRFASRRAETIKQFTTLTAKGSTIDVTKPGALTTVQRLAGYVLPAERVDDIVNNFAAAETVTGKRKVVKALYNEMFDAAGVSPEFRSRFTSQFDEAVTKPLFSPVSGQVLRDGVETQSGLDAMHFVTEWAMPSFRDLYKEATRTGTLNRVYNSTINADGIDRFMNSAWKPAMLLRLGFPIRAGGEELVGAIMREGVGGLVRGRLASSAAKAEGSEQAFAKIAQSLEAGRISPETARNLMDKAADTILPFHPLARVYDRYIGPHLGEPIRNAIETPADFAGAVIGDRTRRAFRAVEGKLAGQDYMNAARELWKAGPLQEAFTAEIAATESRAAGYLDDEPSVIKITKGGSTARPAYFQQTGLFREYQPKDDLYVHWWKKSLDELSQGPLFRAALPGVGGDREAQVQAVVDRIESPGYQKMAEWADRSRLTRDGRVVGVEATQAEANRDWAEAVVDHVNSLVHPASDAALAAGAPLQPVPEGRVRLYRGEELNAAGKYYAPGEIRGNPGGTGEERLATTGRWFSTNPATPMFYQSREGASRLRYVDVPHDVAAAADVRNMDPETLRNIHGFGAVPDEYILPEEWAAKAKEYTHVGAEVPAEQTDRYYQLLDQAAQQGADVFPEVMRGIHPVAGGGLGALDWAENRDRILSDLDAQIAAHHGTPAEATLRELRDVSANFPVSRLEAAGATSPTPIPDLAQRVLSRDVPSVAELSDISLDARPGPVKGREVVAVSRNWVRDVMDRGFEQVVGRPMDWMVRQPLFVHNYATSLKEVEGLRPLVARQTIDRLEERDVPGTVERAFNVGDIPPADFYHGTSTGFTDDVLGDRYSHGNAALNLFGPGFYTTESPSIALSYTGKGARAGTDSRTIYGIRWKGEQPPKLLDLDSPAPESFRHFVHDSILNDDNVGGLLDSDMWDNLKALADDPEATAGELIRKARYAAAQTEMSMSEADEFISSFADIAEGQGFNGFTHVGGGGRYASKSGAVEHKVSIFFNPSDDLDITQVARVTPQIEAGTVKQMVTVQDPISAQAIDAHVREVALQRAVNKTIPFIHDPQLRSQFSVNTRNLMPFWFAQEQFYKRWVNIAKHSPEAFREAQLTMMGLRHSGVIHTDDQGQDYFLYPGAAVVQEALSKGFETLTGKKVSLPLPVGFSGQVRFATPGLERLGVPSFGPLVGIPMRYLAERFPELDQVEQGVLGERGAGRAYWEQITPTAVSRLVHIAVDNPNSSPQMASAMMQAMAYLEAKGFAPADNASPVEREAYIDRVKQWTRILFLNRTLFGYAAPASPDLQMDPDQLHSRYRELLGQLPIEEATAEFLKEHPDATPYTVFQSKSASGATLPATESAARFMEGNDAFLRTYPQAAGWFVPQSPDDTKFSLPAYREQLALEMRQRKTPDQFYEDLKYAEAADQYFKNRDRKNVMLEGVNGDTATRLRETNPRLLAQFIAAGAGTKASSRRAQDINGAWATWKDEFLAAHPVFAQKLASPDAQIQRQQSLDQMRLALQDPRLPQSPQVDSIRELVGAFDDMQAAIRPLQGLTSTRSSVQRKFIKTTFATQAEKYATDHPEVKGFYDRIIRPEVDT